MTNFRKFFFGPGGQNDNGNKSLDGSETPIVTPAEPAENLEDKEEEKPVIDKIKDALQDWSNKDEADQEFDDTRV